MSQPKNNGCNEVDECRRSQRFYNLRFTFHNGEDRVVLDREPIPWNCVLFGSVTKLEIASKVGFFENAGLNASSITHLVVPTTVKELEVGNVPTNVDLAALLASCTRLEEVHVYHSVLTKKRIRELRKMSDPVSILAE
ncbi:MAG: hypothetical protein Q8M16_16130 [Pirellulaceae bacterium]|nr:hypothetical protein [Pirellulaceae bacterium]